jgi:mxaJ protein
VTRRDRSLHLTSLDDPRLARLRVGVQLVGDDGAASPPAHLLALRGVTANVVGYSVYGDYGLPNPPSRIVRAVASGDVDVALAWGAMAGYFAARERVAMTVRPIAGDPTMRLPLVFDISMAVRRSDTVLAQALNGFIDRHQSDIDRLLAEYDVLRLPLPSGGAL